jgi:hypothetical protein
VTAAAPAVEAIEATGGRARLLQRLAALLTVLAIALAIGIVAVGGRGDVRFRVAIDPVTFGFVGTVVAFPIVGALIVGRRPRTIVAWVMIAIGISLGTGVLTAGYGTIGVRPLVGEPFPFALESLVVSQLFFVPALGLGTTLLLLLYPTDTLLTPRWRWPAVVAAAAAVLWDVGAIFRPGELDSSSLPGLVNPLAAQPPFDALVAALPAASNVLAVPMILLAAGGLVLRYRRADRLVKAQIRWFAVFGAVVAVALAISTPNSGVIADIGFQVGVGTLPLLPIAIGIAITRYRLYDIDRLINRTLVYGSLTAILAGVFTAAVGLAQRVFVAMTGETSDAAIVATTLVVATLYAPLRKRLEAIVDRRFKYESRQFGAYRAEVLAYLAMSDPAAAARRLAREAAAELDPVGLAVVDRQEQILASAGIWPQPVVTRLPIGRGDSMLGTLLVGPRRDGQPHDAREVEELAELAILVGTAVARG